MGAGVPRRPRAVCNSVPGPSDQNWPDRSGRLGWYEAAGSRRAMVLHDREPWRRGHLSMEVHHGRTARTATALVRAAAGILSTHRRACKARRQRLGARSGQPWYAMASKSPVAPSVGPLQVRVRSFCVVAASEILRCNSRSLRSAETRRAAFCDGAGRTSIRAVERRSGGDGSWGI